MRINLYGKEVLIMTDDKTKEKGKVEGKSESTIRVEEKISNCGCDCVPPVKSK